MSELSRMYGSRAGEKGYKKFRIKFKLSPEGKKRRSTGYITIKARTLSEAIRKFKSKHKNWAKYSVVSVT